MTPENKSNGLVFWNIHVRKEIKSYNGKCLEGVLLFNVWELNLRLEY